MKSSESITRINLNKIDRIENSRSAYNDSDMASLMSSIRQHGLMQPVGVRPIAKKPGRYELVFGNRRVMAMEKLGLSDVPAVIMDETEADENEAFIVANLTENIQRRNLSPFEEGKYFHYLKKKGLSVAEISARLDISPKRITDSMAVHSNIPKEFQSAITNSSRGKRKGTLTARIAVKVLDAAKAQKLGKKETSDFLRIAKEKKINEEHVNLIGGIVSQGYSVKEAIDSVATLRRISVNVLMPQETIDRLEKTHKKKVTQILTDALRKEKDFRIVIKGAV